MPKAKRKSRRAIFAEITSLAGAGAHVFYVWSGTMIVFYNGDGRQRASDARGALAAAGYQCSDLLFPSYDQNAVQIIVTGLLPGSANA